MIQDILPHKLDNHFRPGMTARSSDRLIVFAGGEVLCRREGAHIRFPQVRALHLSSDGPDAEALTYLFEMDGERYFLWTAQNPPVMAPAAEGACGYVPVRRLRSKETEDRHLVFAAVTALHLHHWYENARFCGRCGHILRRSGTERAMVCPACGAVVYPRINPAVIVGVIHGENLLLTRYAGREISFYALVAGFAEIGESLEGTVAREVMEETGLQVTNIRYYKSQPWGFADDLLAGYYCDVSGDPAIHLDTGELKEAVWVPRHEVAGQADDYSLTNEMMCAFRDGLV